MTPRLYKQNSSLVQWAYLFEEVRPLQTSTCNIFWRSVILTPIKILGPVIFVCVMALGLFGALADLMVPAWYHTTIFTPERHVHSETSWKQLADNAAIILTILITLLCIGVIGYLTGVWNWLHGLCIPVEIEGGLVQRGMCPGKTCTGLMVATDTDSDASVCRKCGGVFTP